LKTDESNPSSKAGVKPVEKKPESLLIQLKQRVRESQQFLKD
jgi:hypothetical protein